MQRSLADCLTEMALDWQRVGFGSELRQHFESLAEQVWQPCVVAVVGRMKTGKSTLLNALLGVNLARVGVTETTATINYFRYGTADQERPVRVYWRSGLATDEPLNFADDLQGHTEDQLRQATAVARLEFRVPHEFLEHITLVDTPGIGTTIKEHAHTTREFLNLSRQLLEQHDEETKQLGRDADAVIYVVGIVAQETDRALMEEFQHALEITRNSSATNSLAVMTKIDEDPDVFQRRDELATKHTERLKDSLNIVHPVSAGIELARQSLLANDGARLHRFVETVRRIPDSVLERLMKTDERWRREYEDCPVTVEERIAIQDSMSWGVFRTLVNLARDQTMSQDEFCEQLASLSGFRQLRVLVEQRFLQRSQLLRCRRIALEARKKWSQSKKSELLKLRERLRERDQVLNEVRQEIRRPETQNLLERLISETYGGLQSSEQIEQTVSSDLRELEIRLDELCRDLEASDHDFDALQKLLGSQPEFTTTETVELRRLFGLHGLSDTDRLPCAVDREEIEKLVETRWRFWNSQQVVATSAVRKEVAQAASRVYSRILAKFAG